MPQFDWTISLGSLITIAGFIVSFWVAGARLFTSFDRRVVAFESLLGQHATTLLGHANRMEKQDDILLRLVGDMQRLIGRVEGSQQNIDRAEVIARALLDTAAVEAKHVLHEGPTIRPRRASDHTE